MMTHVTLTDTNGAAVVLRIDSIVAVRTTESGKSAVVLQAGNDVARLVLRDTVEQVAGAIDRALHGTSMHSGRMR
jgi:hypothetical protein